MAVVELGELGPEVGEDSQGPVSGGHLILPESLADVLAELDQAVGDVAEEQVDPGSTE